MGAVEEVGTILELLLIGSMEELDEGAGVEDATISELEEEMTGEDVVEGATELEDEDKIVDDAGLLEGVEEIAEDETGVLMGGLESLRGMVGWGLLTKMVGSMMTTGLTKTEPMKTTGLRKMTIEPMKTRIWK